MKVNIGVVGRFHAFDLAKELNNHKVLNKLISTYPKFKVKEWGLNKDKIISEFYFEILSRFANKIPVVKKNIITNFINIRHAKKCSKFLNQCDIHIGWSGSTLETILEAKKLNKSVILERGSSHYNYQMKILNEEYGKYANINLFNQNYQHWQRELLEYELADYISIPSNFVKQSFINNGIKESKLILNPYGVDLQNFRQIPKTDKVFRIIFAGTGSFRKGYHYLLQAFKELNLKNCELWHLGTFSKEMIPFMKRYENKNFILKGIIPQKELYKYYSQGNVLVLPSLEEGLAMVQAQAMACGLPLICSTNSGGEDLISKEGQEGYIIPIRNVASIKEKILFLYENQDICRDMGNLAKKKAKTEFSWEVYGNRYLNNLVNIFNKDLSKNPS